MIQAIDTYLHTYDPRVLFQRIYYINRVVIIALIFTLLTCQFPLLRSMKSDTYTFWKKKKKCYTLQSIMSIKKSASTLDSMYASTISVAYCHILLSCASSENICHYRLNAFFRSLRLSIVLVLKFVLLFMCIFPSCPCVCIIICTLITRNIEVIVPKRILYFQRQNQGIKSRVTNENSTLWKILNSWIWRTQENIEKSRIQVLIRDSFL